MKKLVCLATIFILFIFTSALHFSCKKDMCRDLHCSGLGECSGDTCICDAGHYGQYCSSTTPPDPPTPKGEMLLTVDTTTVARPTVLTVYSVSYLNKLVTSGDCTTPGNLSNKISLDSGQYPLHAQNATRKWNFDVIVDPNACTKVVLEMANSTAL